MFTAFERRLFVRFIPHYIGASQRHAEAPRLSGTALEALEIVSTMARRQEYNISTELAPGDMQFVDNYHVLHGRTAYVGDPKSGYRRHLKRLWLAAHYLEHRPPQVRRQERTHWGRIRTRSRIAAVSRASQPQASDNR